MTDEEFKKILKEKKYPFIRPEMTQDEYLDEFLYYMDHIKEARGGNYETLYMQKQKAK